VSETIEATPEQIKQWRDEALAHHNAGRFVEAIQTQVKVLNAQGGDPAKTIDDHKRLGLYTFSRNDYKSAANILERILPHVEDKAETLTNLGVIYTRMKAVEKAIPKLEESAKLREDANTLDALAHCYGVAKRLEDAKRVGERSLIMKDEQVCKNPTVWPIPQGKPAPFRYGEPEAHIISFSLWGTQERYLEGARQNIQLAEHIYPGWTMRFYVDDSVPVEVLKFLAQHGGQIVKKARPKQFFEGLLWRFEPASDPKIKRFLVRDVDSVVNTQERAAVDDWIAEGTYFHVLRDYFTHTELILAGMWGGVGGIFPDIPEMLRNFKTNLAATRHMDQWFLRSMVWPTIKQSVTVHDSLFNRVLGGKDFPPYGRLAPYAHVGQSNPWLFHPKRREALRKEAEAKRAVAAHKQAAQKPPQS